MVCQKKVAERHRAVSCDRCQLWCHIKCGRISIKEYKQMINTLDLVWSCHACNCMNNIPQQMGCPPCLISDLQHELEARDQQQEGRKEFGIFARRAMVDQAREGLCYQ